MKHELKIHPKYFKAIKDGHKTYEIRLNDRNYKDNDIVILNEYDPVTKMYSGLNMTFRIKSVLHLNDYLGYDNNYVVFSLIKVVST